MWDSEDPPHALRFFMFGLPGTRAPTTAFARSPRKRRGAVHFCSTWRAAATLICISGGVVLIPNWGAQAKNAFLELSCYTWSNQQSKAFRCYLRCGFYDLRQTFRPGFVVLLDGAPCTGERNKLSFMLPWRELGRRVRMRFDDYF